MSVANLGDLIRVNAKQHANETAFVLGKHSLTFAQYNARVNRLADALMARGLKKGDRIALLSSNRIEFVEAYGAAEKAGFIAVPLNHRLQRAEIEYIVANSEAAAVIVEDKLLPLCAGLRPDATFVFDGIYGSNSSYEALLASGRDVEPSVSIGPRDVAYMMYTGGTTGRPKGVLLDHYGQMMNARTMLIEATISKRDTLLTVMPLNHIGGKNFANAHFHCAAANILVPGFDAQGVLDTIVAHNVRCMLLAPTMIKMLLDQLGERQFSYAGLETIYYSSAPMPVSLLRLAIEKFGRIFMQFYGLTESGPSATALHKEDHRPDGTPEEQRRLASAGRPMIYNEVEVVDDQDRVLDVGQVGEVRIRGEQIMQGYWRNLQATTETLRNGWIYSGDYGELDEAGYLFVVGRKKDVIISGGENIYPREIEEVLSAHPAVKEVAVVGAPDDKWGEAVTAVIALNDGHSLSSEDVVAYCRMHLASYKKPRQVHFWPSLPRSSLGKLVKTEIRDQFWKGHGRKI